MASVAWYWLQRVKACSGVYGSALVPSWVAFAVVGLLEQHFGRLVDYDFTAKLEDELDAVSRGEEEWVPLMERFWGPFKELVTDKSESLDRTDAGSARVLGTDPGSGKEVSARIGRFGPMVQIGTVEDEEKPKFASLQPGQSIYSISLEDALKLFDMPFTMTRGGPGSATEFIAVLIERVGNRQRAGRAIRLTDHGGTDAESGGDKDAFSAQQFARCGQKPAAFGMGGQPSSSRIPAGHRFNGADGFVQGGRAHSVSVSQVLSCAGCWLCRIGGETDR